jgi:hypothetical protein
MSCIDSDYNCKIVLEQNKKLETQLTKLRERNSTDFQRSKYENQTTSNYKFINSALLWVFYLVVLILAFVIFRSNPMNNLYMKGAFMVCFVVYPFIVNSAERMLYKSLAYSYALMSGTVYSPPWF